MKKRMFLYLHAGSAHVAGMRFGTAPPAQANEFLCL